MRSFWAFISFLISASLADMTPNYYCADMNPQPHINIEQLMGMWYGIEIITHHVEEQHYVQVVPSCPIIHISEDKSHLTTTYSPLHKNYDYRYNYGERRDYDRNTNDRNTNDRNTNDRNSDNQYNQYGKTTQYPYHKNYNNRRYGTNNYNTRGYQDEMKRIRIWWDENGSDTEYNLRYNITRPGFWISSGPQNGSELEPLYSNFAGTVQVIKAVGNHLVLTFCHQLPERQLFTVLLSREHKLESTDIHGVHNLLHRRGLSTSAIKKVCSNGSERINIWISTLILLISTLIL